MSQNTRIPLPLELRATMELAIRIAAVRDAQAVSAILTEAAVWLEDRGMPLWQPDDLTVEKIKHDISAGFFLIAELDGETAGTLKYQLEDLLFWPDVPANDSAFVHRLAARRRFAGGAVSKALLDWAVERTRALGRTHLRLDCEASRLRLRVIYERFGFRHHSDRQVGAYFVARYQYDV